MIWYEDYISQDLFRPKLEHVKKKDLCDNIICFDIETCNYFTQCGAVYSINDIIELCKRDTVKIDEFFKRSKPGALPYIWQFCIDGTCVYGRELPDIKILLTYIIEKTAGHQVQIWIHNLSFEYSFLREVIKFDSLFFTEERKPLYCQYKNLYFRCSYRLTNLSLAKWGSNLGIAKKTGQLDYHALYTPKTQLTDSELEYCEYDVIIMYFGIKQYLDIYKHIAYIPLTLTGIPRRDLKSENQKTKGWLSKCAKCQPRTPEEWKVQNKCYSGGLTLTNPYNTGLVLHDVGSIDKKSAYPYTFFQKFPSTPFEKSPALPNWKDGNHHICLVEYINLRARYDITPLSSSKRIMMKGAKLQDATTKEQGEGIQRNNGKIIKAAQYIQYICEVDKQLIDLYYKYDKMIVHSHWIALSDYMPKHVIIYMLKRFEQKTLLTGIDEVMRNIEKAKLNALYGLSGTSLIHDDIVELDDFTYDKKRLSDDQIQQELDKLHKNTFKNVLPYSWAIYVTAYQRLFLMKMALRFRQGHGKHALKKIVYFDTDSIKGFFTDEDYKLVDQENQKIIKWTKWRCKQQDIPYELTCPENTKGSREYLGIWERDANYFEFKCLRAKAYSYRNSPTDTVHITLAGVPKSAANVLHSVDDLKEGIYFDIFNSRKNMLTCLDGNNPAVTFPDGYKVTNTCGCNIRPTSYKLTLDGEHRALIKQYLAMKYH